MSKRNPKPPEEHLPSDGALPVDDLSAELIEDEGGTEPDTLPRSLRLELERVPRDAMRLVQLGHVVSFDDRGAEIRVLRARMLIGYVRPIDHAQLRDALEISTTKARVSDVFHEGIHVTVIW